MVEFSVRIDFYRDLEAPKDYVGSTLRDGLSAVVLPPGRRARAWPRPNAWRKGPYGDPYGIVHAVEHSATPFSRGVSFNLAHRYRSASPRAGFGPPGERLRPGPASILGGLGGRSRRAAQPPQPRRRGSRWPPAPLALAGSAVPVAEVAARVAADRGPTAQKPEGRCAHFPHKPQMHIALSVPTEQTIHARARPAYRCGRGALLS
jgi:hypothetical protein